MTQQEIFDRVVTHLLTQRRKAMLRHGEFTGCRYRAPDGAKCAVGCLITPEAYDPIIESKPVADERVIQALIASGIDANDEDVVELLTDLQEVHDSYDPEEEWEYALQSVAEERDLKYNPPEARA